MARSLFFYVVLMHQMDDQADGGQADEQVADAGQAMGPGPGYDVTQPGPYRVFVDEAVDDIAGEGDLCGNGLGHGHVEVVGGDDREVGQRAEEGRYRKPDDTDVDDDEGQHQPVGGTGQDAEPGLTADEGGA